MSQKSWQSKKEESILPQNYILSSRYGKDLRVLISTFPNLDRITVSKIILYITDLFLQLNGFI